MLFKNKEYTRLVSNRNKKTGKADIKLKMFVKMSLLLDFSVAAQHHLYLTIYIQTDK
jgi:hypothetical protein